MARQASKFENHQQFTTDKFTAPASTEGLVSADRVVVASDKETQRSGEVTIQTYSIAEGFENPLGAALNLFGGSEVELANFAVTSFNDSRVNAAKAFVVDSIVGPEKTLIKTITRVVKAMGITEDAQVKAAVAKAKANPAYLTMLLDLAGK
jgi:hypothetical protein